MFDWLAGNNTEIVEPKIKFGRYSDSHKSDYQINYWNKALEAFEEKKYLDSYEYFFKYISDNDEGNVEYHNNGDNIVFRIKQGSKTIVGSVNNELCEASATIASFKETNVVFMRKLLEFNFQLKYSCYSFDKDKIKLSFHTGIVDGSPEKLYFALREVATHADRQDDVLISEFESLSQIDEDSIVDLKEKEKEIKHRYINMWITQAFNIIKQLDSNQNDQIIAQILICTAFKIDYFTVPQGKLMNLIENAQQIHFIPDGSSRVEKNAAIIKLLNTILEAPKEEIYEQLYQTKSTFGVTQAVAHEYITKFISEESPKASYIKNQQQYQIHLMIQEYIIQHILYYWGVHPPTTQLLHLCLQVMNNSFFTELGFKPSLFEPIKETLNKKAISKKIDLIESEAQKRFKQFKINKTLINYASIPLFVESIFEVIKTLNFD